MPRLFIDLETTGLVPADGDVLEVAVVATTETPDYTELAAREWVMPCPAGILLDPFVLDMHTHSGLLADCRGPGAVGLAVCEVELCRFLDFYGGLSKGPLGGSSPHFDAEWMSLHLPHARSRFNHRVFCASTLAQFARDMGVTLPPGNAPHRALADVRRSVELARMVARALRPV